MNSKQQRSYDFLGIVKKPIEDDTVLPYSVILKL